MVKCNIHSINLGHYLELLGYYNTVHLCIVHMYCTQTNTVYLSGTTIWKEHIDSKLPCSSPLMSTTFFMSMQDISSLEFLKYVSFLSLSENQRFFHPF